MSDDTMATPRGHAPVPVPDRVRLERMLKDPLTSSAELEAEATRLEELKAALKERSDQKAREEAAEREREAERKRKQDAAAAELRKVLDAGMTKVHKAFPELATLAEDVWKARITHQRKVEPLGINSAVADRVIWAHPLAALLPWLDLLRKDGESRWQPRG